jgi:hypothetical protein
LCESSTAWLIVSVRAAKHQRCRELVGPEYVDEQPGGCVGDLGMLVHIRKRIYSIDTTIFPRASRAARRAMACAPRASGKRSVTAGLMRPSS